MHRLRQEGYRGGRVRHSVIHDIWPYFTNHKKYNLYSWNCIADEHLRELASIVRMLPIAPSMKRFGFSEELGPVHCRYLRSDFESLGAFDLAETCEGGGDHVYRSMVCSVRFYKHLVEQGVHVGFVPVILEDD